MNLDWQARAACRNDPDPDAWFAGRGEDARRQRAVRVCLGCPVRNECLAYALDREARSDSSHGVVGGLTANARRRLLEGVAS